MPDGSAKKKRYTAPVQFRPGPVIVELEKRGEALGSVAKGDLLRYYFVLSRSLEEVDLSYQDALVIADALYATSRLDQTSVHLMWAFVEDWFRRRPSASMVAPELERAAQQGLWPDRDGLVAKLRAMTYAQSFAVYDAFEQFQRLVTTGEAEDLNDALLRSGLYQGDDNKLRSAS